MLVLVNASNQGKPLGDATLGAIRALGAHGVRTDILPDGAEAQLREFKENPDLQLLALIHHGLTGDENTMVAEATHAAMIAKRNLQMNELKHPPIFELGNEPRSSAPGKLALWRDPDRFGTAVRRGAEAIWNEMGNDTLVISGGIHNPSTKEQDWLRKAARHFPRTGGRFAVGFHNYAPGMGDPDVAHRDFKTVEEQIASLKKLGFQLFDTESGGHTAPPENHTDSEIARWLTRRLDLSREWDLLGTVVYELQDGPDPKKSEHRLGLLRFDDRSWKPSATALHDWLKPSPTQASG